MTYYSELLHKLFHINLHGSMKLGLENCFQLDDALGNPSHQFPSIHVAGSNGKGSVVTKMAKALEITGKRVGVYTSPHISTFRERIKINEAMISEKKIEEFLPLIFTLIDQLHIPATFFEVTTLLAFMYFAAEKVDIAVIETGIGGRLDATTIIPSILTVITSVSLDHTEILGSTIEEIAQEKAGIIKPFIPLVIGPRVPYEVIAPLAAEKKSPLFQIKHHSLDYDHENKLIAAEALRLLNVSEEVIAQGVTAMPPCRLQTLYLNERKKPLILDVGHNPDGLFQLFKVVKERYPQESFQIIFGLSKTKDISGCLEILKEEGETFYIVESPNGRGALVEDLEKRLCALGVAQDKIHTLSSITATIHHALQYDKVTLICGTFFIMNEALQALGYTRPQDSMDMNERSTVDPKRA